jgi:hypothetical protein
MTTGNTDIDTLAPEATPVALVSGTQIKVERLKTRALMSLLKILTRGASEVLPTLSFDPNTSTEAFTGQLLGAVIIAIPEAEDEAVEFINRMVFPAGLHDGARLTAIEKAENEQAEAELRLELVDPEIDDLVTILEQIIKVEAPHIVALGKRLALLLKVQQTSAVAKQGASSKRSSRS